MSRRLSLIFIGVIAILLGLLVFVDQGGKWVGIGILIIIIAFGLDWPPFARMFSTFDGSPPQSLADLKADAMETSSDPPQKLGDPVRLEAMRQECIARFNLPSDATWDDIWAAESLVREKEAAAGGYMSERQVYAAAYNLPPDATWDEIYRIWKKGVSFWPSAGLRLVAASLLLIPAIVSLPTIVLPFEWIFRSMYWVVMLPIVFFILVAFWLFIYTGHSFVVSQQYVHLPHPLRDRAKRDGIYVD